LARWQNSNGALTHALSNPSGERGDAEVTRLRRDTEALEASVRTLSGRLERASPNFAELSSPKPLSIADTQQLLAPDEVLIMYMMSGDAGFVWAATRDSMRWQRLPVAGHLIAEKIAGLRVGLDVENLKASLVAGKLFDLDLAHELHKILLEPVAELLKGKSKIIVVPSGPLTSLPFHVLVTDKPPAFATVGERFAAYRKAKWLIRTHAVTVLPAVSSLRALRGQQAAVPALKPLIGFADPMFGRERPGNERAKVQPASARRGPIRSYASYWKGNGPDHAVLRDGLSALPESADELRAVAKALGASEADLKLGAAASETVVKSTDLSQYKVVYFATHGLVAGEMKGLAEPALVLSLPAKPSELDDGLLTASEVAQLKLNADWVVMSACNTAAGGAVGAEALSGLARAFFYAGARALLVSHWKVYSHMAVSLTSHAFDEMKKDPAVGRSEALRRAMLAAIDDGKDPWDAYPDFWAPFSVVGEGGGGKAR
jgi:CHAT domain-containing protein